MTPLPLILSALIPDPAPARATAPDALAVVAAERAFAADSARLGLTASFTKWSTPDAIVIQGDRVRSVREAWPPADPRPADEPELAWWPGFAGISRSGDFGFTTGPFALNGRRAGHYFTVWRRQADGDWKWIYDGGSEASAVGAPGPDHEPVMLGASEAGSGSPRAAMAEVAAVEAGLARAAATDQRLAHLAVMSDEGRLYVERRPPAIGRAAFADALALWPETFRFGPSQGDASDAGDMAWTWGEATWTRADQPRSGHFVRLWRKQAEGWKLVLAQLIAAPPPRARPAEVSAGREPSAPSAPVGNSSARP